MKEIFQRNNNEKILQFQYHNLNVPLTIQNYNRMGIKNWRRKKVVNEIKAV